MRRFLFLVAVAACSFAASAFASQNAVKARGRMFQRASDDISAFTACMVRQFPVEDVSGDDKEQEQKLSPPVIDPLLEIIPGAGCVPGVDFRFLDGDPEILSGNDSTPPNDPTEI